MRHTFKYLVAAMLMLSLAANAQENAETTGQHVRCIAFYNLENLFDTIHDEGKND